MHEGDGFAWGSGSTDRDLWADAIMKTIIALMRLQKRDGVVLAICMMVGLAGSYVLAQETLLPLGWNPVRGGTDTPEVLLPSGPAAINTPVHLIPPGSPVTPPPTVPRTASDDALNPFGPEITIDSCAREREQEATARVRRDTARRRFEELDRARRAWLETDTTADDAERAARTAASAAGGTWTSTVTVDGKPRTRSGWRNPKKGPAADAAQAKADRARGEANRAREKYRDLGSESEWLRTRPEIERTQKEWETTDAALQRCLGETATIPPARGGAGIDGSVGSGRGIDVGIGIGDIAIGAPGCRDGQRRPTTSERLTTKLIDLSQTKIIHNAPYLPPGDVGGFIDWLELIKGGFFEGKKVSSLLESLESGDLPVNAALDIVGFPDFLTYYDKIGDEVISGLRNISEITERLQKTGEYSLRYPTKTYTAACSVSEVCRNGKWKRETKFTLQRTGAVSWSVTKREFAINADDAKNIIERLFQQLERSNRPEITKLEEFEARCVK